MLKNLIPGITGSVLLYLGFPLWLLMTILVLVFAAYVVVQTIRLILEARNEPSVPYESSGPKIDTSTEEGLSLYLKMRAKEIDHKIETKTLKQTGYNNDEIKYMGLLSK